MVCRVADNPALEGLRRDLGIERFCHSQRVDCIHRLPRAAEPSYYGISGAFMGYCQALFQQQGSHTENTNRIATLLDSAGLPWSRSHELFLGHRKSESVARFVEEASSPLRDLGRVPILITGIDTRAEEQVAEILESDIHVVEGETVLVRLTVGSLESADKAARLIRRIVRAAEATKTMPRWWPLLQASEIPHIWDELRRKLGTHWKYVNIAINPFTDPSVVEIVQDQIMVAQIVVPSLEDISEEGVVRVSDGMSIYGGAAGQQYHIGELVPRLSGLPSWPTCIFLGPTLPHWADEINLERVRRCVGVFMREARSIWDANGLGRYAPLWEMAA